jgi:hypothetical protein
MMEGKRQRAWLVPAGFFCLALVVRAVVAALTHYELQADGIFYFGTAENLARGAGYLLPDGRFLGSVPPAFPLFLAGVFKIFGIGLTQAVAAQVVLGAATTILVYYLARHHFGYRAAVIAAAIFAVHPVYVWTSRIILSEALATFLVASALLAYTRASRGSAPYAVVTGLLLGAATLCRSSLLVVAAVLAAGLAFYRMGGWAARARTVLLVAAAFLALTGLWTYRNYRVFGTFVPTTLNAGRVLYEGNMRLGRGEVPTSVKLRRSAEFKERMEPYWGTPRADLEYDRFYREKASELLGRYRLRFVCALPGRFVHFFTPAPSIRKRGRFIAWNAVGGVLMVAAWAGILLFRRPASRTFALLAPVLTVALTHIALKPLLRFRVPVEFILIIYAAAFAAFCFERARGLPADGD